MGTASRVASYVYGVARSDVAPSVGAGVAGGDVRLVRHRGIAALVSDVPSAGGRARARDLLAHSDVLQSAFAAGTVLPLRFGTVFADDDAVANELLGDRHDALERLLDELDGTAELSVRASYVEEAVLAEIVREDARVARLRAASRNVELGEAVAAALPAKAAGGPGGSLSRPWSRSRETSLSRSGASHTKSCAHRSSSSSGSFLPLSARSN